MKVNGTIISLGKSQSLDEFLKTQNYDISKIAIERNGEIVPKIAYKDTLLQEDDTLEIVKFVGGG